MRVPGTRPGSPAPRPSRVPRGSVLRDRLDPDHPRAVPEGVLDETGKRLLEPEAVGGDLDAGSVGLDSPSCLPRAPGEARRHVLQQLLDTQKVAADRESSPIEPGEQQEILRELRDAGGLV